MNGIKMFGQAHGSDRVLLLQELMFAFSLFSYWGEREKRGFPWRVKHPVQKPTETK